MTKPWKHFHGYYTVILSKTRKPYNCVSRKQGYLLELNIPKDVSRVVQMNSFYEHSKDLG